MTTGEKVRQTCANRYESLHEH